LLSSSDYQIAEAFFISCICSDIDFAFAISYFCFRHFDDATPDCSQPAATLAAPLVTLSPCLRRHFCFQLSFIFFFGWQPPFFSGAVSAFDSCYATLRFSLLPFAT